MYMKGLGISPDEAKAREWLQRAAIQQNADAKEWLAVIDRQSQPLQQQEPSVTFSSIARVVTPGDSDPMRNKTETSGISDLQ